MSDYTRVAKAITYLIDHAHQQPNLEELAAQVQLSPYHFQRMFSRWAGVTPKKFLQILSVERAKQLLAESLPLMDVSDTLGFSSSSRLYDHFVHIEAMTPGEYKRQGEGLHISYGVHTSPFGQFFLALTLRGICSLHFLNTEVGLGNTSDDSLVISPNEDEQVRCLVEGLYKQWPKAVIEKNTAITCEVADRLFTYSSSTEKPLSLLVSGTNFQVQVWRALLQIPFSQVTSYSEIARMINRPKAVRAVGSAIGANPIAFLIPCHRVIQQSGKIGGYRWGEVRKHAIHAWESAHE